MHTSQQHRAMLQTIAEEALSCAPWTGRPRLHPAVIEAMARVPRDRFVPPASRDEAYANRALPIGGQQTISQPFIVALMSDLIDPSPQQRVLEVGTGSGYQTAVLAELVAEVWTLERIAPLSHTAHTTLTGLGYDAIHYRTGDGHLGWPEAAPFDAILVTAAATKIPTALTEQLRPGGCLVIPVGPIHAHQTLYRVTKDPTSKLHTEAKLPVAFVPLLAGIQKD